ncbi:P-loop containing nucleoside triphosphate hydrolase protein [Pisolithus marmoratus]|nr:P-loop containing nucleoside triphosphate hydrolase protein [Pisolithus marmoratus]
MPRIRKKTSKRTTTHQREKIKHKVTAHRKKVKKQAKKDKVAGKVQKKSKKDPGIPNAFPYKDEILAEIEQKRREAATEKQRRKTEKRATKAAAKNAGETQSQVSGQAGEEETIEKEENDGRGFDGVTSIKKQPIPAPLLPKNKIATKSEAKAVDASVCPGPSTLREVLDKADILMCVVDARDPEAGISEALLAVAKEKGKAVVILVNKADTVPRESLVEWLSYLRKTYTAIPFRVSSAFVLAASSYDHPANKAKAVRPSDDAIGTKLVWACLGRFAKEKKRNELVVAFTGITNSGKSAIINSLLGASVLPVYDPLSSQAAKLPYTTTVAQEVVTSIPGNAGSKVRFIDTPGLEFNREEFSDSSERQASRARDILLRCRGRIERLKDPMFAVTHILSRAEMQDLMLAYNLPAFPKGDTTAFLAGIARVNGLVKPARVLDHAGAARIVLRDWNSGNLVRYTTPPIASGGEAPPSAMDGDEDVLEGLRTRKELRKEVKLVRLASGKVDSRGVLLDEAWGIEDEGSEDGGDSNADGDDDVDEESVSGESDVEDEEEAPELLPPPPSPPAAKRKRTVSFAGLAGKRRRG